MKEKERREWEERMKEEEHGRAQQVKEEEQKSKEEEHTLAQRI